jgi:hypothetical protein
MRATLIAVALVGMLAIHSVEANIGEHNSWSSICLSILRRCAACRIRNRRSPASQRLAGDSPPDVPVQLDHPSKMLFSSN